MHWKLFLLELKYKHAASLFLIIFTWISVLYNIDLIIFFLAKNLLNIIPTQKFIYTNINDLYWNYFLISISITFLLTFPFLIIIYMHFFFNSIYKYEFNILIKILISFFIYYYFSIYVIYEIFFPQILKISFIFENSNKFFPLYFEARFEDYFFNAIKFILYLTLFSQLPLYLYIYLIFNKNYLTILVLKKKYIYVFFLIFEFLLLSLDLGFLILIFLSFFFIYETFLIIFIIYRKTYKK